MHKMFQLFHKEYYVALFPQILGFAIRKMQTKKMSVMCGKGYQVSFKRLVFPMSELSLQRSIFFLPLQWWEGKE